MNPEDLQIMEGQPDPQGLWDLMRREVVEAALMVEIDFADEPMLISNRNLPFTDNLWGKTWQSGHGLLISVPETTQEQETIAPFREYGVGATWDMVEDSNQFMSAINEFASNRENYWRRSFKMHVQYFDNGKPAFMPITKDSSLIDKVSVSFEGGGMVIMMQVESLFGRMGVQGYGKLTYHHQRYRHSGDEGLQFNTEFSKLVARTNF